jgi:hypothetical protein
LLVLPALPSGLSSSPGSDHTVWNDSADPLRVEGRLRFSLSGEPTRVGGRVEGEPVRVWGRANSSRIVLPELAETLEFLRAGAAERVVTLVPVSPTPFELC